MTHVMFTDAQRRLPELLTVTRAGEAVEIVPGDGWTYRITAVPQRPRPPVTGVPKAGSCKGLFVVPDDFKEPLEELRECME